MLTKVLCLLCLATSSLTSPLSQNSYSGHSVVRIVPHDDEQVEILKRLTTRHTLDVWQGSKLPHHPVDVRVSPVEKSNLMTLLKEYSLNSTVIIDDVQKLVNDASFTQRTRRASSNTVYLDLDLEQYHSYSVISDWLVRVKNRCAGCTIQSIGQTHERRDMNVIKIGNVKSTPKRSIFIDCGIHAREWVSPATCLYIIYQLTDQPDTETTSLLDHFDWYILPVANPDGYEYSHGNDRLWRKNRRPHPYRACMGVDLNRNFGFEWGGVGTSTDPCSDIYGGSGGFSEPESQNMRTFIQSIASTSDMYLSFHSYGQYWLYSWGYTSQPAADENDLHDVGLAATRTIRRMYRTRYTLGSAAGVLYASAGGSDDWAKGGAGIKYSYTVELRDTGRYGFILPTSLIKSTADEAWLGLKASATELKRLHPNGAR